jgi:protein-tyrosine-phosphatase
MVAATARKVLGNRIRADSAGTDVGEKSASPEAIKVMLERGVDISQHSPRDVSSVNLSHYDMVVALSPSIGTQLKKAIVGSRPKLVVWEITDPYGKGLEAYRNCAGIIEKNISKLARSFSKHDTRNTLKTISPAPAASSDLPRQLKELRDYLHNAIARLNDGVLFGSHLVGVGSKSVDLFDAVLREVLRFYLEIASVSYEERLKKVVNSKPVNELTMGQVIVC